MSQVVLLVHIEELNGVLGALGKLPYEASAGMIHKLQAQANEQKQVREIVAALPPIEDPALPAAAPTTPVPVEKKPRKTRRTEARSQKKASASPAVRPPLAKAPEQPAAT